jgi:hypothetical protein
MKVTGFMDRAILSLLFIFASFMPLSAFEGVMCQDTVWLRQQLYNGRVWESKYDQVKSNEFFLTEALTPASVSINGRTFINQLCWYDIYNDQLVLMTGPGTYIVANKERIEEFTMYYMNRNYRFVNFGPEGYNLVLHQGKVFLVTKYIKEIKKNAVDNRYDAFIDSERSYIVKGSTFIRLTGKKDLFNALADKEEEIRRFIHESGIKLNVRKPLSFVAVLRYYDSL